MKPDLQSCIFIHSKVLPAGMRQQKTQGSRIHKAENTESRNQLDVHSRSRRSRGRKALPGGAQRKPVPAAGVVSSSLPGLHHVLKSLSVRSSAVLSISVRHWSMLGGREEDFYLTLQILRQDSILKCETLVKLHETSQYTYCKNKLLDFYSLAAGSNIFSRKLKK